VSTGGKKEDRHAREPWGAGHGELIKRRLQGDAPPKEGVDSEVGGKKTNEKEVGPKKGKIPKKAGGALQKQHLTKTGYREKVVK